MFDTSFTRIGLRRSLYGLLACLTVAVLSGALALAAGRQLVLRIAEGELADGVTRVMQSAEAVADEASSVLDRVNASQYSFCSPSELTFLRGIVLRSMHIRDIGRMKDGNLVCSSMLGVVGAEHRVPPPAASLSLDGVLVFPETRLVASSDTLATVVHGGETSLTLRIDRRPVVGQPGADYAVAAVERGTGKLVAHWGGTLPPEAFTTGARQRDGMLLGGACSDRYSLCVGAQMPASLALSNNEGVLRAFGALGCVAGLAVYMAILGARRRERSLEARLRRALRAGELSLVYQPVVHLASGLPMGAEALVRWRDQEGREVSAEEFVQLAEDKGFIGDITRFVLTSMLHEMGPLLHAYPAFRININLAAGDVLDAEFAAFLQQQVEAFGVQPWQVGLELTERSAAERSTARQAVRRLRERGHRVYIDDFGTGYSSLSHLAELDADAVKVDKAFVRQLDELGAQASIMPQVVEIARKLELDVVIEGIESEMQAAYCGRLSDGILGQGHYLAYPMAGPAFAAWLAARQPGTGAA